jgi:general stress protein 26
MLVGKMEVLTDLETKNMIWRKGDTMFYKKGVTDMDYCDLKTESFEV